HAESLRMFLCGCSKNFVPGKFELIAERSHLCLRMRGISLFDRHSVDQYFKAIKPCRAVASHENTPRHCGGLCTDFAFECVSRPTPTSQWQSWSRCIVQRDCSCGSIDTPPESDCALLVSGLNPSAHSNAFAPHEMNGKRLARRGTSVGRGVHILDAKTP